MLIRCEGPCSRDLEPEAFQECVNQYGHKARWKTCRICKSAIRMKPHPKEWRCHVCKRMKSTVCKCGKQPERVRDLSVLKRGEKVVPKVVCPCGQYRPKFFNRHQGSSRVSGTTTDCKVCAKTREKIRRRDPAYRKRAMERPSYKRAQENYKNKPGAKARRMERQEKFRESRGPHVLALNRLNAAVRYGKVQKAEYCECRRIGLKGCKGKKKSRYGLIRNDEDPIGSVVWLSRECHWAATRKVERTDEEAEAMEDLEIEEKAQRTADRYGVDLDLARRLTVSRSDAEFMKERDSRRVEAFRRAEPKPKMDAVELALWTRNVNPFVAEGFAMLLPDREAEPRPNRRWQDLRPDEKPEGSSLTMAEIMASPFVKEYYR